MFTKMPNASKNTAFSRVFYRVMPKTFRSTTRRSIAIRSKQERDDGTSRTSHEFFALISPFLARWAAVCKRAHTVTPWKFRSSPIKRPAWHKRFPTRKISVSRETNGSIDFLLRSGYYSHFIAFAIARWRELINSDRSVEIWDHLQFIAFYFLCKDKAAMPCRRNSSVLIKGENFHFQTHLSKIREQTGALSWD